MKSVTSSRRVTGSLRAKTGRSSTKRFIISQICAVLFLVLFGFSSSQAEPLQGTSGSSDEWGSGWFDLKEISDFKKGEKLIMVLGGTAKKIVLRFLPKGANSNDISGVDGTPRQIPKSRTLEIDLKFDHKRIKQISVHGGSNPWGKFPLGQENGPATIISIERISPHPKK